MTTLEVTLDGKTTSLEWADGQLMLEALEGAGLSPPHSCRSGSCGACICTLTSGEVELRANDLLDAADLAAGMILSCQALAKSGLVKVVYE